MSLAKILRIISLFSPIEASSTSGERGFDFDLNIRLGPLTEMEIKEFEPLSAAAAVGQSGGNTSVVDGNIDPQVVFGFSGHLGEEKCSEEADDNGEESEIVEERKSIQSSEIESHGVFAVQKKTMTSAELKGEGCLDLLIEAAELVAGGFDEEESEPRKPSQNYEAPEGEMALKRLTESDFWTAAAGDFEDISPVVKSKRGRNQVLPYKYRDSFLEPLNRLTRHRSSATVLSKRRSR